MGSRTLSHLLPPLGVAVAASAVLLAADILVSSILSRSHGGSFAITLVSLSLVAVGDGALGAWLERRHVARATPKGARSASPTALRASRAGAVVLLIGLAASLVTWLGANRVDDYLGIDALFHGLAVLGALGSATFLLLGLGYTLASIGRHRRARDLGPAMRPRRRR
ncbi:hypothetical protein N865_06365 [Intrasporangium oryzae NRRL B-24470]|uniref:Uncharacterized protein n=1 Tax=Intrasporangium oryzae NRRL B-24470 TaxID=1386089 RepID=W9GEV7_9MICO|nr:hypothetical protein [Intrasporangium oryzae]EWT02409.1 hypothetical protein N865_06365 [Intrasporangium oryzae NRRL B-24470]